MSANIAAIPTTLKWSKQIFSEDPSLSIVPGSSTDDFKLAVQQLTGVPVDRQKLLSKCWKGMLKSDATFDTSLSLPAKQSTLTITLIGSAETLAAPPKDRPKFIEDVTPEEREAERLKQQQIDEDKAEGMIVALQRRPGEERNADSNRTTEPYQYDRMVYAVPQYHIESILRKRRTENGGKLMGNSVMTFGLELRRAYVNDLETLPDGTLLSALDDGHVQMWRHAELEEDVQVMGGDAGGVEHILAMPLAQEQKANFSSVPKNVPIFATAGQGQVQLFNCDGQQLGGMQTPQGTSPCALVAAALGGDGNKSWLIATASKVTYQPDPNQFRLIPQDEAGRRRRAAAEEMERQRQQMVQAAAGRVTVMINGGRQFNIDPISTGTEGPPIRVTALATISNDTGAILVCGNAIGDLRLIRFSHSTIDAPEEYKRFHIQPQNEGVVASIICMEHIGKSLLAISTTLRPTDAAPIYTPGSVPINISDVAQASHAIYIIDFDSLTLKCVLKGHVDAVTTMKMLPDGSLVTCGGKMDATTKLWNKTQLNDLEEASEIKILTEASATLDEVGYVFSVTVLPDTKAGSEHYAIATARYNVVKICI